MKILKINTENRKKGDLGEEAAAKFLKSQGYKILERNYVAIGVEIDIIAEKKDCLSFIEVKSRTQSKNSTFPRPCASVTPEKQRKIISAAKYYIGGRSLNKPINLDVIEVYLEKNESKTEVKEIKHLICAYNLNTAHGR